MKGFLRILHKSCLFTPCKRPLPFKDHSETDGLYREVPVNFVLFDEWVGKSFSQSLHFFLTKWLACLFSCMHSLDYICRVLDILRFIFNVFHMMINQKCSLWEPITVGLRKKWLQVNTWNDNAHDKFYIIWCHKAKMNLSVGFGDYTDLLWWK